MSRASTLVSNPAVKTLKFKNEKFDKKSKKVTQEAGWFYWDKNGNDGEGENIKVEMPITFLWLETAQSFTGFNKEKETSVYSNEILTSPDAVKKYGKKQLEVKVGNEHLVTGFYKDIKAQVKDSGGKFCMPVYAAMQEPITNEWEIVRFLMTGGSGSAWIDFNNRNKNLTDAIVSYGIKEIDMSTGDSYQAPQFKYIPATDDQLETANTLVEQVDAYFDYILNAEKEEVGTDY